MKFRVLGCSGAEMPGHRQTGFLINDSILLDAGTAASVLDENAQQQLKHIFITHAHLDHVSSVPALVDNLILSRSLSKIKLYGLPAVLETIKLHLLNGNVWPDFTRIFNYNTDTPVMAYVEMEEGRWMDVDGISVKAVPVHHSIPAAGFMLEKDGRILLYTGDTGSTDAIWKADRQVHTAIVEVSFPNSMNDMAIKTGHLTPSLLKIEIAKMHNPPEHLLITHLKPQYLDEIIGELLAMKLPGLTIIKEDETYEI